MTNELLVPMLASTAVVVAGWVATHLLIRRRDRANKRRDQRVQFIIDAYRRLERAANRAPEHASAYHADIESAVADILLFGTASQVRAAREFATAFAREGRAPLYALLEHLRADLRGELGLGAVPDGLVHLRITAAPSYPVRGSQRRSRGGLAAAPPNVASPATRSACVGQHARRHRRTRASARPHGRAPELGRQTSRALGGVPGRRWRPAVDCPRLLPRARPVRTYTAVVERDPATGLYVGHVPGFPGAHSQGATLDELRANLEEVVAMLVEDGEPALEAEFVGTQTLRVA